MRPRLRVLSVIGAPASTCRKAAAPRLLCSVCPKQSPTDRAEHSKGPIFTMLHLHNATILKVFSLGDKTGDGD